MPKTALSPTTTSSTPTAPTEPSGDLDTELDRQLTRLLASGQLPAAGWSESRLRCEVAALQPALAAATDGLSGPTRERMPYVLVVPGVAPSVAVTTLRLGSKPGFLSADTSDIDDFRAIAGLGVPTGLYAAVDVRRGEEHLGATPDEAMAALAAEGRSPLTIGEGLALLTVSPSSLEKNHCFQTPGSRIGDRRVPGLWISGRAPKLGFCWAGNRHTWLGIASCAGRVTAVDRDLVRG